MPATTSKLVTPRHITWTHGPRSGSEICNADGRLAASGAEDMERLATSREAIAYSENLLARLKREGK
jgi:hypothetical protein